MMDSKLIYCESPSFLFLFSQVHETLISHYLSDLVNDNTDGEGRNTVLVSKEG